MSDYKEPEKIRLIDGGRVNANGVGSVSMEMLFRLSKPKKCIMHKVVYVPMFVCNLLSARAAATIGNLMKFGHLRYWIRDTNGKLCGMVSLVDKLYQLDCEPLVTKHVSIASQQGNDMDL